MTSEMDEFRGRVQATIWDAAGWISDERRSRAQHYLEHSEAGEAMYSLAWAIAEERTLVPRALIVAIRDLSEGLVDEEDMPTNLDDFGIDDEALDS